MAVRQFSIVEFGAQPNVEDLQTEKIQAAIDACFLAGGGEVVVPAGVFITGSIRLRSNITLHLLENAVIKGVRDPECYFGYLHDQVEPLPAQLITDGSWNRAETSEDRDYRFMRIPGSRWNNALIRAFHADNIAIIGEKNSVLDGSDCYDELGEEQYRGPHCINFYRCRNITFRGYTVRDSANWAHTTVYCDNVLMENVTVLAGHDGIHMNGCKNITIMDSRFYTGDDCVAGFANLNLTVKNCVMNSACSAMRLGGTNILVEACKMYGPCEYMFRGRMSVEEKKAGAKPNRAEFDMNMLSVFTYYADYSWPIEYTPGNVIIKNCAIDHVDRFLHFNYSGNEMWQQNKPLTSIRFEDIKATDISMPLTAYGDEKEPITVELKNVDITARRGSEQMDLLHVANYRRVQLENVTLHNFRNEKLIKTWSDGCVEIRNLVGAPGEGQYVVAAEEPFVCDWI